MTQTELVEAMARAIPDKIPRCLLYLPREHFDAVLAYVAFRVDQAHRAGEVAMRERIAGWLQQGEWPVGLMDDCGADELATAISTLEVRGMGDAGE